MITYRDLISHDGMFSDIYKILEITDGLHLEVESKMVSKQRVTLMTRSWVEMPPLLKAQRQKAPKAQQS